MNKKTLSFLGALTILLSYPLNAQAESIPFPLNKDNPYKKDGDHFLSSSLDTITWGHLPNKQASAVMEIESGETVTIDTVSHEGLLEDQGRDPLHFFGENGINEEHVLDEAVAIAE